MLPDNIKIVRACVNQKWYYRLYVDSNEINDFETIEDVYAYIKEKLIK